METKINENEFNFELEYSNLELILSHPYASKLYIERLLNELETERMRLAGCGVAALAGEKALDCLDQYKSASMFDTVELYKKNLFWKQKAEMLATVVSNILNEIYNETGSTKELEFVHFLPKLIREYEDTFIYKENTPKKYIWEYKPKSEDKWHDYDESKTEFEMKLLFGTMQNWEYRKKENQND